MLFQSRAFHVPKDYETPQYYEDASAVNQEAGRVAIADGVSSAVFSGAWADILTRSVVAAPPNIDDPAEFATWLELRRKEWAAGINVPSLPYHLLMKLRQVGGGFSTLAWIEVRAVEGTAETEPECLEFVVRGQGVGDACVFHVREGQILTKWPMVEASDFEADPISIGSVNFQRDQALEFQRFEWICRAGDLLVLATDAVSAWVYRMLEAGEAVNWQDLSQLEDSQLAEYLTQLRESHWLKRDDSTIVFVELGLTEAPLESEPEIAEPQAAECEEVPSTNSELDATQVSAVVTDITTSSEEHVAVTVSGNEIEQPDNEVESATDSIPTICLEVNNEQHPENACKAAINPDLTAE
jgi:hypothetical protein